LRSVTERSIRSHTPLERTQSRRLARERQHECEEKQDNGRCLGMALPTRVTIRA